MAQIKAIIWDLDNTLYRFNTLFEDACNHIAGHTVRAMGLDMGDTEAKILAEASFKKYGYSMRVFMEEHGLDSTELHLEFHKHLDEKILDVSHELIDCFKKHDLRHVLVTHGSRHWAMKALNHLSLKQFFPDHFIFGLEDYDFKKKDESPFVFEMAMDLVSLTAPEMVMAEDTLRNLSHPHALGMKTVLVHHGRKPQEQAAYVDHMVHSAQEIFPLTDSLFK
jgi:putative hydrolase of the HAD superfamily